MLTRLTPASQGRELWNTKFGEGVVLHPEGLGEHAPIQVNFERGRGRSCRWCAYTGLRAV
ncbi:MAG: hypothetical protein M3495_19530 [Pseudomonadota bacterium]|nr:hypothetical protein [Gammaproteobacteria bacterium]MDQ3583652.1 hypothetical protein [Pseudomonadota bacterium]